MAEIAIVDDEEVLVNSLRIDLRRKDHVVHPFHEANPFLTYLNANEPDLVFLDLQLPDINGLEVLRRIKRLNPNIPVIIITAYGNVESAVKAMKAGAFDYINKPFDISEISILIEKALGGVRLVKEVEHHRHRAYKKTRPENIVGDSTQMVSLMQTVQKLSTISNTTILIQGENGTGKDLLAKVIHNLGTRCAKQFIEVNCASIPENLLESEMFGYEKGAFTDARERKTGLVELADGGTLFLDEICELPLTLQAKLLKFIESKTFRRIGGKSEIRVDVLIISATNRDLQSAVNTGLFRQDLYYRLNVLPLWVPPLRDRGTDISAIADYYLDHFSAVFNKPRLSLDDKSRNALLDYHWPGNVRELKNLIERLVILSSESLITHDQLPVEIRDQLPHMDRVRQRHLQSTAKLDEILDGFEKELIGSALKKTGGVKSETARILGISRYALLRRLKRLYGKSHQ
ncbi:MAG: sigma-54-dependent Fis family transcriptional regulator [Desulfobacteraceae bacterium]|nr:sigma-54-dependent Fis family transcriptional regulator [Desulfobacteraceae bacterium]